MGARAERSLRDLLAAERECCPFWRFALTRTSPRRLRLRVRAEAPFEDALVREVEGRIRGLETSGLVRARSRRPTATA